MESIRSAERIHTHNNYYRSPPRSPLHSITQSPPSFTSDALEKGYPRSEKYDMPIPAGRPLVPQNPQSPQHYASDTVEVA